jgi:hypothetical protein
VLRDGTGLVLAKGDGCAWMRAMTEAKVDDAGKVNAAMPLERTLSLSGDAFRDDSCLESLCCGEPMRGDRGRQWVGRRRLRVPNDRINPFCDRCDRVRSATDASLLHPRIGRPLHERSRMKRTPDCFATQEQNDRKSPFCDRCDPLRIATDSSLLDSRVGRRL